MIAKLLLTASALSTVTFCKAALAPFITKCRTYDVECHKANVAVAIPILAAGIPNLGIETLDPMILDFVNASGPKAMLLVSNGTMTGLKDCISLHINRDPQKSKLFLNLSCHGAGGGKYELSGNVLGLNEHGQGDVSVSFPRFEMNLDMDIQETDGEDGKKYFNITKFEHNIEMKEKSVIIFEDLFRDNERLNQEESELMKNNDNRIVKKIGAPMFNAIITNIVDKINNFFKAVPIQELTIDYV